MINVMKDAVGLLRAWWRYDRIRSSPRAGQLLRLAPGAILCVAGETTEVHTRDVATTAEGPTVRYRCHHSGSLADLWIIARPVPEITWSCGDNKLDLAVEDIEVWSEGRPGTSGSPA